MEEIEFGLSPVSLKALGPNLTGCDHGGASECEMNPSKSGTVANHRGDAPDVPLCRAPVVFESRARMPVLNFPPAKFRGMLKLEHDGYFKANPWQEADFQAVDNAWLRIAGYDAPGGLRRAWIQPPRAEKVENL